MSVATELLEIGLELKKEVVDEIEMVEAEVIMMSGQLCIEYVNTSFKDFLVMLLIDGSGYGERIDISKNKDGDFVISLMYNYNKKRYDVDKLGLLVRMLVNGSSLMNEMD